jgi:hypothetical protein
VKLGTHAERVIVIGGHYDSHAIDPVDHGARTGGQRSGSQTALVLGPRGSSGSTFDATLIFAAFAAEQGLAGSAQLARTMRTTSWRGQSKRAQLRHRGGDTQTNTATTLKQFRLFSPGTPREINRPSARPTTRRRRHHALHQPVGCALCTSR